jgi:hypothetical protein
MYMAVVFYLSNENADGDEIVFAQTHIYLLIEIMLPKSAAENFRAPFCC